MVMVRVKLVVEYFRIPANPRTNKWSAAKVITQLPQKPLKYSEKGEVWTAWLFPPPHRS
jgi:hypothetical protein